MPETPRSHLLPNQSFLQSDIWGSFRETVGWNAHKIDSTLVLERPMPMGKTFLYAPEVVGHPEMLLELLPKLYSIAERRNSIFLRLELLVDETDPLAEQWRAAFHYTHFVKSFEEVQPEHRQVVLLTGEESTILSHMKPKGRYNIRLAEKSGVLVRESTPKSLEEDVATFYELFKETGKRDIFSIRPKSYFDTLCAMLYEHHCGRVFIASYEGKPLAASIITLYDNFASYLYGASSSEYRNVMAPYAMHWAAIQWAMTKDAKAYDLLAIRPPGTKKHAYDGITRFKQQFGGEEIHLLGSWDLPLQRSWYTLFTLAEKLRRH